MKRTLLLFSIFIISLLLIQCNSEKKAIHKTLTEMATELNESTPVMLDQYTRFDQASVTNENIFQYIYTILNSTNPDSLIGVVESSVRANIKREFSVNPQLMFFKENNVSVEYVYNDENSKVIKTIRIDSSDYQ
ncbi:MAG TPA: hypothetical protein VKX35_01355 [Fermentimonas sp.]|nr:hypothetical protein [Fermentimonas sp.]